MDRRGYGAARKPKRFAEGGTVSAPPPPPPPPETMADKIRKFVGMPTKQRGKQLDQQEKDILK